MNSWANHTKSLRDWSAVVEDDFVWLALGFNPAREARRWGSGQHPR